MALIGRIWYRCSIKSKGHGVSSCELYPSVFEPATNLNLGDIILEDKKAVKLGEVAVRDRRERGESLSGQIWTILQLLTTCILCLPSFFLALIK
jgi:hypothetical protein